MSNPENVISNFHEGQHGCPIGCEYCVVTKVDSRRDAWNQSTILGINKAVTILNPPPDRENKEALRKFYDFPVELLEGDMVGFNAISDPFWPKYCRELEWFLTHVPQVVKLATCVTKWPVNDKMMERLAQIPNFRLIMSMTGADSVERGTTDSRVKTLARAKKHSVRAFPIIHPYIPGVSDLSFLPELKDLGYDEVDIKGLRYNPRTMGTWMPPESQEYFAGSGEKEVLVDDGFSELIAAAGLTIVNLGKWYRRDFASLTPHLPRSRAEALVSEVIELANITSSDTNEAVIAAAIDRRL